MSAAGKFRDQITLYLPATPVSDGLGGFVASQAETSLSTWANVKVLAAREDLVNGKISYRQPVKFTLRYQQVVDITNTQRIEWQGRQVSIVSVQPDERNTEIILVGYANS